MTPLSAPLPPLAAPVATPAPAQTAIVAPMIGSAAVTAITESHGTRHDAERPAAPPRLPAPLKGLGIPPLNTRQVGDFDKLEDPPPPMGLDMPERLTDLNDQPAPRVDLRR